MPSSSPFVESWVERFRRFLLRRRFSRSVLKAYSTVASAFIRFLEARGVDPSVAQPSHVRSYLKVQLVRYRRRQRREPLDPVDWRSHHTAPIHLFLRWVQVSGHHLPRSLPDWLRSGPTCEGSVSPGMPSRPTASSPIASSPFWNDEP